MPRKTGLGRGLDALIPGSESAIPSSAIIQVQTSSISRNPRQPRTRFDPAQMAELESSIRTHGVLQPLIVTRGPMPDEYVLVAGERRWLAARQAGLESVPAVLREASEQQLVELALVENVQRADLEPLEAAEAYRQLVEDFGLSHEEVAARVGKSRVAITNTLRLLKLPAEVQQALVDGKITEGHGRVLLALPTPEAQCAALKTIVDHQLNVRQAEELVRKLTGERPSRKPMPIPIPEIAALEERLRKHLGTRVRLRRRGRGGTVVIHFYSDEELDALIDTIVGNEGS